MKKPNITTESIKGIDFTSAELADGRYMIPSEITLAYSEMIDALIESTNLLEDLLGIVIDKEAVHEIQQQIEMNKYSALQKAGVIVDE